MEIPSTWRADYAASGAWVTGFDVGDEHFGGAYAAESDERAHKFVQRLKEQDGTAPRILECGCLEGGHTSVLARAFPASLITAVDVREDNIARARLLMRARGFGNVRFVRDDLESPTSCFCEDYDAVFCVGLLYHLRQPADFLRRCAERAPLLWLWTVFCAEPSAEHVEGPWRGRIYREPTDHPLSGVRHESFFPTLGSLIEMMTTAGYRTVEILDREETENGNGPAVLLAAGR